MLAFLAAASLTLSPSSLTPQQAADALRVAGLNQLGAYRMLDDLCTNVGTRLNGSPGAERAVEWGVQTLTRLGFTNVQRVPCMVPHWVRGNVETLAFADGKLPALKVCALGNSPATPSDGLTAPMVEVQSLAEAEALKENAKGKFIFFNRPFDASLVSTGAQYGKAGDQRFAGPALAAKLGAAGALVRSLSSAHDDVPHTGTTRFTDARVPCVALGIQSADRLSQALKINPRLRVTLNLACQILPDVPSASVIGEIRGSEKPDEVIVMGGHLDSWDKGQGAHDDGTGIVHAVEALRLIKEAGLKPKRTIRVVMWMNEENSGTGGTSYAEFAKKSGQKHLAGMESDSGGFAPRGFSTSLKGRRANKLKKWQPVFQGLEFERFALGGGGGADVDDLGPLGTALFGLQVESQRYFDYHHSDNDTIDKVNPRELELGAIGMALLAYLISENGI